MYVREGDRLVLNGVYEPDKYAYWDAMSYFGFYTDTSEKPTAAQACKVELLGDAGASKDEVTWTIPNQEWPEHHPMRTCTRCNKAADDPEPGPETNLVHITGFTYLPGNAGFEGSPLGPPVVAKGDELTFINEDFALGSVRHSVTSCRAPCNGDYMANFPFSDGRFHSGALGYMWQETYINARQEPTWTLDTSNLKPGRYTYYCQLHAWMRGSFYVR
jgi:plastocyanin